MCCLRIYITFLWNRSNICGTQHARHIFVNKSLRRVDLTNPPSSGSSSLGRWPTTVELIVLSIPLMPLLPSLWFWAQSRYTTTAMDGHLNSPPLPPLPPFYARKTYCSHDWSPFLTRDLGRRACWPSCRLHIAHAVHLNAYWPHGTGWDPGARRLLAGGRPIQVFFLCADQSNMDYV